MDLNIADAANDPTVGIDSPDKPVTTTTTDDTDKLVVFAPEPTDPDAPINIPFNQVIEEDEPEDSSAEEEQQDVEQIFAPGDEKAKVRLSDMVVQLTSSIRLRVAQSGLTLDEVIIERKDIIENSTDLDDQAKHLSVALLEQAYHAAKEQPPVDIEDKQTMGALNALAHGVIKASDAGKIQAKISSEKKKDIKSKKTKAGRKKNKVAKKTRRKQRRKK